jgi:hypothetical protein
MSSVKIQGSATGTAAFTIAVPDGTSTDRTIELPDAAGSFVLADGSNNVAVTGDLTVDTSTLHVDSTNNRVGVGTSSPAAAVLHVAGGNPAAVVESTTSSGSFIQFRNTSSPSGTNRMGYAVDDFIVDAGGSEKLRMSSGEALTLTNTKTGVTSSAMVFSNAVSGGAYRVRFDANSATRGDIRVTTSSVAYNTTSDARLKENVVDLDGAIDRVKQIPVHRFNFIANPDETVDGFLAHEVQAVVPEAVSGTQDEVDEDGNPVYQGIDQSKLVPLLTAAIKEQQALIEDLQTRIAALEAV